jgi:hypothetical protein
LPESIATTICNPKTNAPDRMPLQLHSHVYRPNAILMPCIHESDPTHSIQHACHRRPTHASLPSHSLQRYCILQTSNMPAIAGHHFILAQEPGHHRVCVPPSPCYRFCSSEPVLVLRIQQMFSVSFDCVFCRETEDATIDSLTLPDWNTCQVADSPTEQPAFPI